MLFCDLVVPAVYDQTHHLETLVYALDFGGVTRQSYKVGVIVDQTYRLEGRQSRFRVFSAFAQMRLVASGKRIYAGTHIGAGVGKNVSEIDLARGDVRKHTVKSKKMVFGDLILPAGYNQAYHFKTLVHTIDCIGFSGWIPCCEVIVRVEQAKLVNSIPNCSSLFFGFAQKIRVTRGKRTHPFDHSAQFAKSRSIIRSPFIA